MRLPAIDAARPALADLALLAALKAGAMLVALHAGFAQISDDDYARTVIAQNFAHAPRLDPSGTSWLPLPFWLYGAIMMIFGRSLGTARALAFVLGVASVAAPYLGLRAITRGRWVAVAGAALVSLTPWSVWLGLAPVPEGWAGVLVGAALFFLAARTGRGALAAGALVLVASLSRYEGWPAAAFVAIVAALRARGAVGRGRLENLAGAALAVLGPIAWLANNAWAHGDALHFFARVAAFRRASTGQVPLAARVLEYPRALWQDAPEIVLAAIAGAFALARRGATPDQAQTHAELRSTWAIPLAGACTVMAMLVYGDVRDGAPTHHPARALMPVLTVLAGFGADGLRAIGRSVAGRVAREAALVACAVFFAVFAAGSDLSRARAVPAGGEGERRDVQIARGRDLASKDVERLVVTPCAYEHFALIAAFGAPERVEIVAAPARPVTPSCPDVASH